MYPKSIKNLIEDFSKLPSIGPRQATRIVFSLLARQDEFLTKFSSDLSELKNNVKLCQNCFLSYEAETGKIFCNICLNPKRKKTTICVVQKEIEVINIEKTALFNGVYHIIGEDINIFKNDSMHYAVKKLIEKIEKLKNTSKEKNNNKIIEIILATNPTTEGDSVLTYLKQKLKDLNIKISILGRGLSSGGELEYIDQNTLSHAFKNRTLN